MVRFYKGLFLSTSIFILFLSGTSLASAMTEEIELGNGMEIVQGNQGIISSEVDSGLLRGTVSGSVDTGNNKGYWIRGDKQIGGKKNVYSSYKNYKKQGAASVTSGTGTYVDGGYKKADTMSTANTLWTSKGTNKVNYRYK